MSNSAPDVAPRDGGLSRRRFIGYLIAGPTSSRPRSSRRGRCAAAIPTVQPVDPYDLTDLLDRRRAADGQPDHRRRQPRRHGLVRAAAGRGRPGHHDRGRDDDRRRDRTCRSTRSTVTLADARPELVCNQLTGGSNSMHSIYTPVRVAAAIARGQLAAARRPTELGARAERARAVRDGVVTAPGRTRRSRYGALATDGGRQDARPRVAASAEAGLAAHADRQRRRRRIDAVDIVTGRKKFAMDLDVPGALPTMVCRPPTINGTARSVANLAHGQGDAGDHRRRRHPAHAVRPRRRRRPRPDLRPVHRRGPRAQRRLGSGHRRRQVRRRRAGRARRAPSSR